MSYQVRLMLTLWVVTVVLSSCWVASHYGWEKMENWTTWQDVLKKAVSWLDDWLRYPALVAGFAALGWTLVWVLRLIWEGA